MARGKRAVRDDEEEVKNEEPIAKRRSSRQAAAVAAVSKAATKTVKAATKRARKAKQEKDGDIEEVEAEPEEPQKPAKKAAAPKEAKQVTKKDAKKETKKSATKQAKTEAATPTSNGTRDAVTPDPDPADIPVQNPDVERHEGKCYWLLKAEPETRMEGGVDVRFSIDDLRARTKPEGWDGKTSPTSRCCVDER